MSKQVQNFIDDARRFQRCSDHDLAISSLQLAQQEDHHKEHEIEIQKLFSLSYRKIGNYNMALLHINNAINQNAKRNNDKQAQNEHAICLMNKGIIYEESSVMTMHWIVIFLLLIPLHRLTRAHSPLSCAMDK